MESIEISGKKRESVGKASSKTLRNAGFVPCVVYGGKDLPLHITVELKQLKKIVYTSDVYKVNLNLEGEKVQVVMQDLQFDPVSDLLLHVDFIKLEEKKPVTLYVPFRTTGNSIGVREGGALRINARKLKVNALPKDLPDSVEVDISPLKIGDRISVSQLTDKKFNILHPGNTVLVDVKTSRNAAKIQETQETEAAPEEKQ